MSTHPKQEVDEIHRLMMHLAADAWDEWDQSTSSELLDLLEQGDEWIAKARKFFGVAQ